MEESEKHDQILKNQKTIMKSLQLLILSLDAEEEELTTKDLKIGFDKLETRILETKELV